MPVGNKPLLSYPLDALQAAGFHDVIVVSNPFCLSHRLSAAHRTCCTSRMTVAALLWL